MPVKPIPDGYHTITPYLHVEQGQKLIDFLAKVFGAKEIFRSSTPDGRIQHCELQVGDSRLMLAEPSDPWKPMPCALYLYIPDVDAAYLRALNAGATSLEKPADKPYGDRNAGVQDFAGNLWWMGTHIKDVSHEELSQLSAQHA